MGKKLNFLMTHLPSMVCLSLLRIRKMEELEWCIVVNVNEFVSA